MTQDSFPSPPTPADLTARAATRAWVSVFAAGVVAAMHVWKFPGALHAIRADIPMTLVQAGTLLGIVQVAAMLLGLTLSLFSVRLGMRTTLLVGLTLLAAGSFAGAMASATWHLMTTRAIEGVGFILVGIIGPGLIRHWAPPESTSHAMGWWSAFQGTAVFAAMVAATLLIDQTGLLPWSGWWVLMGGLSLAALAGVLRFVPTDLPDVVDLRAALGRVVATVRTPMPWIMAVIFSLYTLQWTAIIGFLPDIAAASGLGVVGAGLATAFVGGINGVGTVIAGRMLQRGASPRALVMFGMAAMALFTVLTFAPDWLGVPGGYWYQLASAALFSGLAAVIPTTILRAAVDVAPPEGAPSAVMGLMNQMYSAANFLGPVLLAAIATAAGTWRMSWTLTVAASVVGLVLALVFLTPARLTVASRPAR